MNLTKTIDTMKKINAQDSKLMAGMGPNSPEMVLQNIFLQNLIEMRH